MMAKTRRASKQNVGWFPHDMRDSDFDFKMENKIGFNNLQSLIKKQFLLNILLTSKANAARFFKITEFMIFKCKIRWFQTIDKVSLTNNISEGGKQPFEFVVIYCIKVKKCF